MLAALIPGVRELRGTLTIGGAWLSALLLGVLAAFPSVDSATNYSSVLVATLDRFGTTGKTVLLFAVVALAGRTLRGASEAAYRAFAVRRLEAIGDAPFGRWTTSENTDSGLPVELADHRSVAARVSRASHPLSYSSLVSIHGFADKNYPDDREEAATAAWVAAVATLNPPNEIADSDPNLYARVLAERTNGVVQTSVAPAIPLIALGLTLHMSAPLPNDLGVVLAGTALGVAQLLEGFRSHREANVAMASAVVQGKIPVESPDSAGAGSSPILRRRPAIAHDDEPKELDE